MSDDGTLLAYGVDTVGDERYTLRFKDLSSARCSPTRSRTPHPVRRGRPTTPRVLSDRRRRMASGHRVAPRHRRRDDDVRVFHEPDERFWVGMGTTRSDRYLMIAVGSKITSEVHVLDASEPTGEFRVVWPRRDGIEYDVEHAVIAGEDRFLITHNEEAENFEVLSAPVERPVRDAGRGRARRGASHRGRRRLRRPPGPELPTRRHAADGRRRSRGRRGRRRHRVSTRWSSPRRSRRPGSRRTRSGPRRDCASGTPASSSRRRCSTST